MYHSVASNMIKYFRYESSRLYVLADEAYTELAQAIKAFHGNTEVRVLQSSEPGHVKEVLDVPHSAIVLLLAEPATYVSYKLDENPNKANGELP